MAGIAAAGGSARSRSVRATGRASLCREEGRSARNPGERYRAIAGQIDRVAARNRLFLAADRDRGLIARHRDEVDATIAEKGRLFGQKDRAVGANPVGEITTALTAPLAAARRSGAGLIEPLAQLADGLFDRLQAIRQIVRDLAHLLLRRGRRLAGCIPQFLDRALQIALDASDRVGDGLAGIIGPARHLFVQSLDLGLKGPDLLCDRVLLLGHRALDRGHLVLHIADIRPQQPAEEKADQARHDDWNEF